MSAAGSNERGSVRAWFGNAAAMAVLIAAMVAFARWQAGPWWVAWPRAGNWVLAGVVVLAFVGLCVSTWLQASTDRDAARDTVAKDADATLLAWASQTGFAQQLAEHTAQALREAGMTVRMLPLHRVDADVLRTHRRALFIVSTTGEGDPPDHALGFTRRVLGEPTTLAGLEYAVLALGDRAYERFCGFGRRLDQWLHHNGARPLFDRIDVDAGDAGALRHWQHRLGQLSGHTALADWSAPQYGAWALVGRLWHNPGGVGGPAYHVELVPDDRRDLDWQAGDIAEIGPRHAQSDVTGWLLAAGQDGTAEIEHAGERIDLATLVQRSRLPTPESVHGLPPQSVANALAPLPHREYSIASLPQDGSLQLLVRQMRHADGRLGSGSGWLTEHAPIGTTIDLRIRRNIAFHPPRDDRSMILIGNGTGLAGLRAHLKARALEGHRRNWLVFGERQREHDFHHHDEIEGWFRSGHLQHLDLAFSRDGAQRVYVQDVLRERTERLRDWIADGAAVYVCGSLEGMAPAVEAVLRDLIGLDALEAMAAEGRYCRDVY